MAETPEPAEHVDHGLEDTFPASDVPKTPSQRGVVLDLDVLQAAPAVSATVRRMLLTALAAVHQGQIQMAALLAALEESGGALGAFCQERASINAAQASRIVSILTHFGASNPGEPASEDAALAALHRQSAAGPARALAAAVAVRALIEQEAAAFEGLDILARRVEASHIIDILKECAAEARRTAADLVTLIERDLLPDASSVLNEELPKAMIEKAFGGL